MKKNISKFLFELNVKLNWNFINLRLYALIWLFFGQFVKGWIRTFETHRNSTFGRAKKKRRGGGGCCLTAITKALLQCNYNLKRSFELNVLKQHPSFWTHLSPPHFHLNLLHFKTYCFDAFHYFSSLGKMRLVHISYTEKCTKFLKSNIFTLHKFVHFVKVCLLSVQLKHDSFS